MMRVAFSAIVCAAVLAAHQVSAAAIADEQLQNLVIGTTRFDEVIQKFGRPMSISTSSDGTRVLVYAEMKTRVKAATFIPVVGLFAGGAKSNSDITRLEFDASGLLTKAMNSSTQVDCGIWGGCGAGGPALGPMGLVGVSEATPPTRTTPPLRPAAPQPGMTAAPEEASGAATAAPPVASQVCAPVRQANGSMSLPSC